MDYKQSKEVFVFGLETKVSVLMADIATDPSLKICPTADLVGLLASSQPSEGGGSHRAVVVVCDLTSDTEWRSVALMLQRLRGLVGDMLLWAGSHTPFTVPDFLVCKDLGIDAIFRGGGQEAKIRWELKKRLVLKGAEHQRWHLAMTTALGQGDEVAVRRLIKAESGLYKKNHKTFICFLKSLLFLKEYKKTIYYVKSLLEEWPYDVEVWSLWLRALLQSNGAKKEFLDTFAQQTHIDISCDRPWSWPHFVRWPVSQAVEEFVGLVALVKARTQQYEDALWWYRCLGGRPQGVSALVRARSAYNAGVCFLRLGDKEKALGSFQDSVALGGDVYVRARKPKIQLETKWIRNEGSFGHFPFDEACT